MIRSFRTRLALRFTATMAAGVFVISALSLLTLRALIDRELNAGILEVASIQAASVTDAPTGEMHFHEWELTPEEASSLLELIRYAQIWNESGQSLLKSQYMTGDLPLDDTALGEAAAGRVSWTEGTYQGVPIRSLYYPLERLGALHEQHVLQVAAPLEARNDLLRRLALLFAGVAVVVILSSFLGSWWLAGRAVRPVHEIMDQAEAIEAGSLERRISAYAEFGEYERLVQVLNTMLARLEGAFEAQKRFTADASHELRSPLTVMRGELELALRKERAPGEYRRVISTTLEEAIRLANITEDLLTLARSHAGAIVPKPRLINVGALAYRTTERLRPRAEERKIQIAVTSDRQTQALVDPDLLAQVIWNLVDNGLKFSNPGGVVTVRVSGAESDVRIEVIDSGPGLGKARGERVFERFFRGDASRTAGDGKTGSGLGLAIAKAIVEAHGGSIEVTDQNGGGARFTVRVPRGPVHQGTSRPS
jgi:two-component system OmpR family sensor kinase